MKAAVPAAPPSFDDDEEDDLPRPGKVWTGPSLAELARAAQPSTPPPAPAPVATGSNIEPVDPSNLPAVWQQLVTLLAAKGPMIQSLVTPGRLVAIQDGVALIRYAPQHDTFVKMLERNGKKEIVRDKLAEVLGRAVGVKFEIDPDAAGGSDVPPPAPTAQPAARPATPRPAAPRPEPEAAEPPPAAPVIKLTPDLIDSLRQEPLVKALMDQMGATIVKVE